MEDTRPVPSVFATFYDTANSDAKVEALFGRAKDLCCVFASGTCVSVPPFVYVETAASAIAVPKSESKYVPKDTPRAPRG